MDELSPGPASSDDSFDADMTSLHNLPEQYSIECQIRGQVLKEWLSGYTRDEIAAANGIGAGTVSNIINELKKGVDSTEYESIRELALLQREKGLLLVMRRLLSDKMIMLRNSAPHMIRLNP